MGIGTGKPNRNLPEGERLRGVELFASGNYRGRPYTAADIDEIAANAKRLGPFGLALLDPPGVIGHEEDQEYLERTDLPAAGWVDTENIQVRHYEDQEHGPQAVMIGDIYGVPKEIADDIRAGKFRKISAEIYPDFTDDHGKKYGKALRRVAFLGAEVPQVKRIADLPMPEAFSDWRREWTRLEPRGSRETKHGTVLCFAETNGMTREEMKAKIVKAMPKILMPTLNAMSDDQLADLCKNLPNVDQSVQPSGDPPVQQMGEGDMNPTKDEMIAALTEAGADPAALAAMPEADIAAMFQQLQGAGQEPAQPMADPAEMSREELMAELTAMGVPPEDLEGQSDEDLREILVEMIGSEPAEAVPAQPVQTAGERQHMSYSEAANFYAKRRYQVEKLAFRKMQKSDAEAFCERLIREGRLLPAQRPLVMDHLMKSDNVKPQTFSENGKTIRLTPYERLKAQYARGPVLLKFSERVGGRPSGAKATTEQEVAIVRRFAEANENAVKKQGKTVSQFVECFSEMTKKKPEITAADYLGEEAAKKYLA
jgi:hypothetical protein